MDQFPIFFFCLDTNFFQRRWDHHNIICEYTIVREKQEEIDCISATKMNARTYTNELNLYTLNERGGGL